MFNNHSPFLSEFLQEVQSLLLPQTPSLTWTACSWSLYFPGLLWPSWHPPSAWGDAKGRRLWMSHLQTRVCTLEHSLVLGQVSKTAPAILGHRAGKRHEHWPSVTSLCACVLSRVWLFATPWAVACQASLSMGFPRQEYLSGLPSLSPGDLPDPGIEPVSPALAGGFVTAWAIQKASSYT